MLKRIAVSTTESALTSLYAQYQDSLVTAYVVYRNRVPRAQFLSKEAARAFFERMSRGEVPEASSESISREAREISEGKEPVLASLAALARLAAESARKRGSSLLRVGYYESVVAAEGGSTAITTNRPFAEWDSLFPNAASVTALIDRLVDRCDVVEIDGPSYREKRFKDRLAKKEACRKAKTKPKPKP